MKNYLINTLVTATNMEISFTREEFKLYKDGKLSLLDIKFLNSFRTELNELLTDKNFYRIMVSGLAFVMASSSSTVFAAVNPGDTIDKIGYKILSVVFSAMKWICLIKAGVEIGKEIGKGGDNSGNVVKIALKYLLAFGILLLLPQFFDWVEEACMIDNIS